jgi:hypothetical protein
MSINALTNDALKRNADFRQAAAAAEGERRPRADIEDAAQNNQVTNALSALTKYIPTEAVTLYIAAVSATVALKEIFPFVTDIGMYWFFAAFTPIFLFITFLGKRRAAGLAALPSAREWPWWDMVAATVAFLIWALAVPGNQLLDTPTGGVVAGFLAIFVSTILSGIESFFRRPAA